MTPSRGMGGWREGRASAGDARRAGRCGGGRLARRRCQWRPRRVTRRAGGGRPPQTVRPDAAANPGGAPRAPPVAAAAAGGGADAAAGSGVAVDGHQPRLGGRRCGWAPQPAAAAAARRGRGAGVAAAAPPPARGAVAAASGTPRGDGRPAGRAARSPTVGGAAVAPPRRGRRRWGTAARRGGGGHPSGRHGAGGVRGGSRWRGDGRKQRRAKPRAARVVGAWGGGGHAAPRHRRDRGCGASGRRHPLGWGWRRWCRRAWRTPRLLCPTACSPDAPAPLLPSRRWPFPLRVAALASRSRRPRSVPVGLAAPCAPCPRRRHGRWMSEFQWERMRFV